MDEIEQIQLYLEGKLEGQTLETFELRISSEPAFQQKVEEYETLFKGLKHLRTESAEQKYRTWSEELPGIPTSKKSKRIWLRIAVAASVTLLAILSYWILQPEPSFNKFIKNNYANEIALKTDRSGKEIILDYDKAEFLRFLDSLYQESQKWLSQIKATDTLFIDAQYLIAQALFNQGEYEKAIAAFDRLPDLPSPEKKYFTTDFTNWTKILCKLGLYEASKNEAEKAVLLEDLDLFLSRTTNNGYKKKAENLKSRLR